MPHSLNVRIPDKLWEFINSQETYATPSEFVRELIRKEEAQQTQVNHFNSYLSQLADYKEEDLSSTSIDDIIASCKE